MLNNTRIERAARHGVKMTSAGMTVGCMLRMYRTLVNRLIIRCCGLIAGIMLHRVMNVFFSGVGGCGNADKTPYRYHQYREKPVHMS